jgi:23S rRNA (adenine2503-C2)-methyltransferase
MQLSQTLYSKEDKSVNFVFDNWLEARFVRRTSDYFIAYLSSHDGCNKACRFCHLTQTGQTSFNETTLEQYVAQAKVVLEYYGTIEHEQGKAQRVNFNFMARGEPLANSVVLNHAKELFDALEELAKPYNLKVKFNVSTIFPEELKDKKLEDIFAKVSQEYGIYYSLYSVNEKFRKRWLPKALPYTQALKKIEQWQEKSACNAHSVFHWAFIKGENDSATDMEKLKEVLSGYNIKAKFNLVRYNPYSKAQGEEATEQDIQYNFDQLNEFFNSVQSRIVPRVGYDVKASCGMFVSQQELAE